MGQPAYHGASAIELIERWSRLHHGLRPAPSVRRWLGAMWTLARPLARLGVPPMAITVAGGVLALGAPALAGWLPLVSFALVAASAVCDGLDGALAVVTGRATRAGAVADAVADRVADSAFALTIWRCGAPLWLAVLAGGLSLVQELTRAVVPMLRTVITLAERPTRVICTLLACVSAAVSHAAWPPAVCAAVWAGVTVAGLVQFLRAKKG
jgi:CDP-diacylglycerol--glycerol-3-phosphate 3-phosphatidyltransferase